MAVPEPVLLGLREPPQQVNKRLSMLQGPEKGPRSASLVAVPRKLLLLRLLAMPS